MADSQHTAFGAGSGDVFMVTPILPDSLDKTSALRFVPLLGVIEVVVVAAVVVEVVVAVAAALVLVLLLMVLIKGWSSLLLEFVSNKSGGFAVGVFGITVALFFFFDAVLVTPFESIDDQFRVPFTSRFGVLLLSAAVVVVVEDEVPDDDSLLDFSDDDDDDDNIIFFFSNLISLAAAAASARFSFLLSS